MWSGSHISHWYLMEVENGPFVLGCYLHKHTSNENIDDVVKKKKNKRQTHITRISLRSLFFFFFFFSLSPHHILTGIDAILVLMEIGVIVWLLADVFLLCVSNNRWVCSIRKGFYPHTHTHEHELTLPARRNAKHPDKQMAGTIHISVIA